MDLKDYIAIAALLISITSLVITLLQKRKENYRTIRKNLSDTLESVAKIAIETTKLRQTNDESDAVVDLRRAYNTQRRVLIVHADFLVTENDEIVTEIDCNILATALISIGDLERAEHYWSKTIEKSQNDSIKHMNLRGYARFLFLQGQFQLGRSKYEDALRLKLADNDYNRRLVTDTCILWAKVEREHGNISEFRRLVGLAHGYCSRIGNMTMRDEMEKQINLLEPTT
ncbi:hypothetical protein [Tellurirhabdus rosea]|uniref:hypothetical protein n=1 Tax=Tellurirhabdus rosea TaxID=2674997 RepID=UPI0022598418|nr:hypothetical protein [Tellurirhabdus rosea]